MSSFQLRLSGLDGGGAAEEKLSSFGKAEPYRTGARRSRRELQTFNWRTEKRIFLLTYQCFKYMLCTTRRHIRNIRRIRNIRELRKKYVAFG